MIMNHPTSTCANSLWKNEGREVLGRGKEKLKVFFVLDTLIASSDYGCKQFWLLHIQICVLTSSDKNEALLLIITTTSHCSMEGRGYIQFG